MKKMFVAERRKNILDILNQKQRITVKELSKLLTVSEATLRSDLNKMEQQGLLKRTFGGAVLNDYSESGTSFSTRANRYKEEKIRIAQCALSLIEHGQCLLIDASSTGLELARLLKNENKRLTIITNGIYTAMELSENPEITVILIGGLVSKGSSSIKGTLGVNVLNNIHVDMMFTSGNGFTKESGLTDFNYYEVELKREMVKRSDRIIALVDHSKLGRNSIASFVKPEDIDIFISDQSVEKSLESFFLKHNITFIGGSIL
ncbi:DeoR/GlpR family DNA-binding transcription regulator [Terrilactibacillus laevilacticus]|uniref:DeoR/GlpR family DNA-binding transcription regulator n=1 Tax=Terrilactibacillus laevilacticus TaxID=1380157 RepID=A0ABW5PTA9_9BACI|nr:DeoR/GlpR family DNA-binding transcription regulator [Terrilactibacillus laevilacticus]